MPRTLGAAGRAVGRRVQRLRPARWAARRAALPGHPPEWMTHRAGCPGAYRQGTRRWALCWRRALYGLTSRLSPRSTSMILRKSPLAAAALRRVLLAGSTVALL